MPSVSDAAGALAEPLVAWLVTYLLHSTVLVCAVWLGVRFHMVRAARTQDLLWKLALLGGVATSAGATVRQLRHGPREVVREVEVHVEALREQEAIRWTPVPSPPSRREAPLDGTGVPAACRGAIARTLDVAGGSRAAGRGDLAGRASVCLGPKDGRNGALVLVWLTMGLAGLSLEGRRRWLLQHMLAAGEPPGPRMRRALERVAPPSAPLPDVRISHLVASPCVLGRTIVFPERCENELSAAELDVMLAHEWGHVSRRDGMWTGIADAVVSVLWMQPLNRLTRRKIHRAAELVCDDWAVDRTGQAVDLARSIWRVAVWSQAHPGSSTASALAGSGGCGLSERVSRILGRDGRIQSEGRVRRWAAAMLLAVPLVLLPARAPGRAHAVVLARERVMSDRAPGARMDSVRVEVRTFRLR
jgi:hypothetical protein